jgi:glycosyltransferase involved in cell wall biosynthesis
MIRASYLQVGPPEHGICRYGRALAAEGRRRAGAFVIEENITLEDKFWTDLRRLRELGRKLSSSDFVHIQVSLHSDGSWGRGWYALANLWTFRRYCRVPLIITLHDVNSISALVNSTKAVEKGRFGRRYSLARVASRAASLLLAITTMERNLLQAAGIARNPVLIPHFVENFPDPNPHSGTGTPAALASIKTVVVAGFVLNAKGHDLLLDAMKLLPDVRVAFVGGQGVGASGREQYSQVISLLQEKGVIDQVEVTGYLPDEEFRRRLSMADLAVCPFREDKSASGSLSSLIAAGCPVLASDIPLIAEYNAIVPGAIHTFSPYTAEALAASIRCLLTIPRDERTRGLAKLRNLLSIAAIYNQHVDAYQSVLGAQQLGAQRH